MTPSNIATVDTRSARGVNVVAGNGFHEPSTLQPEDKERGGITIPMAMVRLSMAKQFQTNESVLHVQTDLTGRSALPVQGIVDSHSRRAKLQVCDSGIENFPDTRADNGTRLGFRPLTLNATRTQSLDEWLIDTAGGGTNPVTIIAQRGFLLKADTGNAGTVYIGDAATAAATPIGFPLGAGESLTLEVTRGSNIFIGPSAATQTLHWIAV